MIDAMHARIEYGPGSDIVSYIADRIVVARAVIAMDNTGASVAAADLRISGNVVDIVADDSVVGTPIRDPQAGASVARNIKTYDIEIRSVQPYYSV
jgi:hypothetical protein